MTAPDAAGIAIVLWGSLVLAATILLYTLLLLALSRYEAGMTWRGTLPPVRARAKSLVVVVPCYREEDELRRTLAHLHSLDQPRMSILVVEDNPRGGAAEVVRGARDPRVHLVPRDRPDMGRGTGVALNAALAHLRSGVSVTLPPNPGDLVLWVLRPGEWGEKDTVEAVLPVFDDPHVALVQVGEQVDGREHSLLARVQDIEEVLHAEVFQRGRQHLGGRSLGCAGQFVRLSALNSLGAAPWSGGPTPELDLGVRLVVAGWRSEFTASGVVHRSAPSGIGDWLGHRARREQRRMQCWSQMAQVLEHLHGITRGQLLLRLSAPFLLLVTSLAAAGLALWAGALAIGLAQGDVAPAWWWAAAYLVVALVAYLLAGSYQEASGLPVGRWPRWRTVLVLHLYPVFMALWWLAGWWALAQTAARGVGRRSSTGARHAARHRRSRRSAWGWLVAPMLLVGVGAWLVFGVADVSVQSARVATPPVTLATM